MNATSFRINQNRLIEVSCCKIVLNDSTILYINCKISCYILMVSKQYNCQHDLLNQAIEDVSKLKGELLLLGNFNYPNINWKKLYVSHTPEHCASKFRSSHPKVFLRVGVQKICCKFTGEHPCRSAISIKLQSNFIDIVLWDGCSPVNLLHIFRPPFPRNTARRLLL